MKLLIKELIYKYYIEPDEPTVSVRDFITIPLTIIYNIKGVHNVIYIRLQLIF